MEKFFPKEAIRVTGNPVRQDILQMEGKKPHAIEYFGLKEGMRTILIIGGSLGARTLNHAIAAALKELNNSGLQIIWQTGKTYHSAALKKSVDLENVKVHDFIQRMDLAYCMADLVISRAGASSISELCIVGRPSILVPFPYAAEDHQTKNAQALTTHDAAIMIPDNEAQEKLVREALKLINDSDRLEKLEANVKKLAFNNADEAIANEILSLIP
jgi:UDP-N-acetylglucosamine--N-acetylmuramyl-(pentapeptide) pyrophosphoryl-undecaprenol N-acetylglucosamine transferase